MALSVEFKEQALKNFADNVVRLSKINLGASRNVGGKRRVTDNTGKLRSSLSYIMDVTPNSFSLAFLMEEYGQWVDQGRKPGKGAPPEVIRQWVREKPIRPRDKNGGFKKITDASVNSLAYLINRKIKREGIKPTNFFSEPFEAQFDKLPQELIEAFALDVEDFLKFTTDGNNL